MKWKKARYGRCVHCLRHTSQSTNDHVFPESWYPSTARRDLPKWQIPTCGRCNSRYGRLEEELLLLLGLCIDPHLAETAGIVPRVLRSINPVHARNLRDAQLRLARQEKLRRRVVQGTDIPTKAIFPGLGERWSRPADKQVAVTVPAKSFRRLTEKIVRGIYYLHDGQFIEPPFAIEHYVLTDTGAAPLTDLLRDYGQDFAHEPGLLVRRAVAVEDATSGVFSIEIWKTFKLYAVVINKNLAAGRAFYCSPVLALSLTT